MISVVIPLYNKERHIARAIRSVLSQTWGDFELVVVDDGSTDGGAEIVDAMADQRIRLVRQANAGASAARNRGIAVARAEMVAFLDADDEWLPEHLETIERLADKYPGCGAYAAAYAVVAPDGKRWNHVTQGIPAPPWEGMIPNYFRSAASFPVWTSAVAVPKRVFDIVGLFPVGVEIGEDLDMWCRIALRYPICFNSQVSAVYHKEAENRACMLSRQLNEHSVVRVVRRALRTGLIPPELQQDAYEFIASNQIVVAGRNILDGDPRHARLLLRSCRGTRRHAHAWRRLMLQTMLPPGWPARLKAARDAMRNLAGCRE